MAEISGKLYEENEIASANYYSRLWHTTDDNHFLPIFDGLPVRTLQWFLAMNNALIL